MPRSQGGLKPHCGSLKTALCSLPTASLSPKLRKGVHMIVSFAYKVSLRVLMVIYRAVDPRKARAWAPADKGKKSVAYVWRGSPPFLIESRLGAYILSSIGAVGGVSAAKRVETATGGCRKGYRRGSFGEWARFESSGDCLPTRILKSRIFKKHPAARFSPLTRLRSLDASIRVCICLRMRADVRMCAYFFIYIHIHAFVSVRVYIYVVAALYAFILHICKCIELHQSLYRKIWSFFTFLLPYLSKHCGNALLCIVGRFSSSPCWYYFTDF